MDTPETLAAALVASAAKAIVETRAVVQKGALNIKTQAKANVAQSAPVSGRAASQYINYDTTIGRTTIDAEIGYDKDHKAARLGNLLEFGGGGDHSPPHRDLGRALESEAPRYENAMALMAEKLL